MYFVYDTRSPVSDAGIGVCVSFSLSLPPAGPFYFLVYVRCDRVRVCVCIPSTLLLRLPSFVYVRLAGCTTRHPTRPAPTPRRSLSSWHASGFPLRAFSGGEEDKEGGERRTAAAAAVSLLRARGLTPERRERRERRREEEEEEEEATLRFPRAGRRW